MMRALLNGIVWLASTAILAPVCFYALIGLAGPRSSILPPMMQPAIMLLGWILLPVAPVFAARAVWRRAS